MDLSITNYEHISEIKSEINIIKDVILDNMNERIIENQENIQALDDRTKMFCPDREIPNEDKAYLCKLLTRLEKQAKDITALRKAIYG